MKKFLTFLIMTVFILPACMGKNYKRPDLDLPETEVSSSQSEQTKADKDKKENQTVQQWWTIFNDDVLNAMEKEALEYNSDLQLAIARVTQAKGKLSMTRSNQYPRLDIVGSVGDSKSYDDLKKYDILSSRFSLGLVANYEFDLWGQYARAGQAAKAEFLASKADKDAVILSLTAEVAKQYFMLRTIDAQIIIAENTLKSREESFNVYQNRFNSGVINELDLRRVEAEMESVRAQLYSLQYELKQIETAISVLLGKTPKAIAEQSLERGKEIKDIVADIQIPQGIPSDLISRRPDLKKSEMQLKAANADVGSAKAVYFPSIALTGSAGFASYELKDLFEDDSKTWSYSGNITVPIFRGGQVKGNYKIAKAQFEQALTSYKQAVRIAFKEVFDAINSNSITKDALQARQKQTAALERSYELSLKREKAGISSLLDVLDVERMLLQSQIDLASAQMEQLLAIVDICKSLGGGWIDEK